jgi:hypothetical protein
MIKIPPQTIDVSHAFDPELREAQQQFDAYLGSRPEAPMVLDDAEIMLTESASERKVDERIPVGLGRAAISIEEAEDITRSFDVPVVAVHKFSKANKLGMMIDDIRDNADYKFAPFAIEHDGSDVAKLTERLLPQEAISAIRRIGQHYEDGKVYRIIDHVGEKENGTFHPHYYFIDRTVPGKTRMYFVDPEHKVAKNNLLRPSIANLVGIEVSDDETEAAHVAVLRYKIPEYQQKLSDDGLDSNSLRLVMEEVLNNGGNLPKKLKADFENKVLFMIASFGDHSRVQARYSSKEQIDNFAKGGRGSSALEGKVQMQQHIINKLIRLFNKPSKVREIKPRV